MGAGLAQRALLETIDKDAKLVLVAMALMALDTPRNGRPSGIYFGGHEYLMGVYRGEIPGHGTPEYQAARQAVKRCLMKLTAAGSIELLRPAARGRQAEYRLTFAAG